MWQLWLQLLPFLLMLGLGFGIGHWREHAHLRRLVRREHHCADMTVSNQKAVPRPATVRLATLVTGEAVIATDYFKSTAAKLRNIIGGEVKTFETLMGRARREATLRMLEQARELGANEVWNVRFETSNIRSAGQRNPGVSVEVLAFGTAVVRG